MKITDLRVRTVAIPLNAQLRHNTGVHPGYLLRTVLELITDEGIVGLGEVGGGDQRAALAKLKPRIVGMDPFDLEAIKLKVLRAIYYLSNARLYGAIEIACLDIQTGKEIWSGNLASRRVPVSSSPVLADGKIYVVSEKGTTYVLEQGDALKILAVNEFDEYTLASPVFTKNRILIRTFETLYCIGK